MTSPATYVIPSERSPEYQAALYAESSANAHQAGQLHDRAACGIPHRVTTDDVITQITEAPTEADAVRIMRMQSRPMVLAVADQLFVEAEGHGLAIVRRECVTEARS